MLMYEGHLNKMIILRAGEMVHVTYLPTGIQSRMKKIVSFTTLFAYLQIQYI